MAAQTGRTSQTRDVLGLALLAAVCAAANLTKPVHIDDAAYLAIVNWIPAHPLQPLSGLLNWADSLQLFSALNQPVLYIYLQSVVWSLFGPSLLAQHALMAVMSAGVVLVFHRLARAIGCPHPVWLTALLVLGPVFLPGQNLMMDVPALLCWLICFWGLLTPPDRQTMGRLVAGAAALAAAVLIKYTGLVLLPIYAITLVWRGQGRRLWLLAIPLAMLAAWSVFNLFDYGGIHLFSRSLGAFRPTRYLGQAASWLAGLGALAPFTVAFVGSRPARGWPLAAAGLAAAGAWLLMSLRTRSLLQGLAWAVIIGNGVWALALAAQAARRQNEMVAPASATDDVNRVLILWLAGAAAFTILFAPFMAMRHLLPAVAPLLLLLGRNLRTGPRAAWAGLALTAALGLWLAASDFAYAAVYPAYAAQIAASLPSTAVTRWTIGHWGWQWYAQADGLTEYDMSSSRLAAGDFLVAPTVPHQQALRPDDEQRLALIQTITVAGTPLTWLRTMSVQPWGGYYDFSIVTGALPWTFSTAPLEQFRVFRVY